MRIFIAVNLPEAIRQHLAVFQNQLKENLIHHKITWVEPKVFHVTLEFLGDVNVESIKLVKEILKNCSEKFHGREIKMNLFEFAVLPSAKQPRVLIFKGRCNSEFCLSSIQREIHNALLAKGFDLENKIWQPHITLGRFKAKGVRLNINKFHFEPVSFNINSLYLMSSELTATGPIYSVINRFSI